MVIAKDDFKSVFHKQKFSIQMKPIRTRVTGIQFLLKSKFAMNRILSCK